MAKRVRPELAHLGALGDVMYDFGPRPLGNGLAVIATRRRQEERPPFATQDASLHQIGCIQLSRGVRIGDNPRLMVLGSFGS